MRRFVLPTVVLASQADEAADPGEPEVTTSVEPLTTPLFSVRRAPEWLRGPTTDRLLAAEVRSAVAPLIREDTTYCVALNRNRAGVVRDGTEGGNPRLIPGELQRIVTAAAFLEQADGTGFTTAVVRDAGDPDENGVVEGSVYLVGAADPVLASSEFDPTLAAIASTSFEELAVAALEALTEAGITGFTGGVVGDQSRHTPEQLDFVDAEVWTRSQYEASGIGPLSALLVDNGFDAAGGRVDPPVAAAARLQALLTFGGVTFAAAPGDGLQPAITDQIRLAEVSSPDVTAIATRALVDPTTAEMLYKEMGLRAGLSGLNIGGLLAVGGTLDDAGLVPVDDGLRALDGSGLADGSAVPDNANQLGCDHLVAILDLAAEDGPLAPVLPDIADSLVADCAPPGAEMQVLAVTRPGIMGIGGVALATNGDTLTFAQIANTGPGSGGGPVADPCADVMPDLLAAVAAHPLGPPIEDYSPLPVITTAADDSGGDG